MTTTTDLIQRVRQRADMEKTNFVSDAEILALINTALGDLYDEAVKASENYFITPTPITISAEMVDLPTNLRRLEGIDYNGNSRPLTLARFNFKDRHSIKSMTTRSGPFRYCVVNRQLLISPIPTGSYQCTLWYVPRYVNAAMDEEILFPLDDYEDYAITWAAAQCLIKEESDPTALLREAKGAMDGAIANLPRYDNSEPLVITDVYAVCDHEDERYGW